MHLKEEHSECLNDQQAKILSAMITKVSFPIQHEGFLKKLLMEYWTKGQTKLRTEFIVVSLMFWIIKVHKVEISVNDLLSSFNMKLKWVLKTLD